MNELLLVVVGGAIGVAGSAATTILNSRNTRRADAASAERDALVRLLEEVSGAVAALYRCHHVYVSAETEMGQGWEALDDSKAKADFQDRRDAITRLTEQVHDEELRNLLREWWSSDIVKLSAGVRSVDEAYRLIDQVDRFAKVLRQNIGHRIRELGR